MSSSTDTADGWLAPREAAKPVRLAHSLVLPGFVLLCCLSFLPYLIVSFPPIADFANHAARLDLACHANDPTVAAMYRYRLGMIPDLAIDLVNLPLCGTFSSAAILKAVICASLALIYSSAWLMQRKLFGRPNAFLFLLPAMAFNMVTTMGYINFLAGVAIVCLMVALAIGRERQFGALLLIGNLGGIVAFFCHIFALAIGMLFFFGLVLRAHAKTPRGILSSALKTAAIFMLPLALISFVPSDAHALSFGYVQKGRLLIALFMANRSLGVYGLILLAPLAFALKVKDVELHERFRLPLALVGLYVLLVPSQLNDAVDIDSRSLVALAYIFFAALAPRRDQQSVTLVLGALAAGLVGFQLWSVMAVWQPFSRQVEEFRAASAVLPANAKVLPVRDFDGPQVIAAPMAYMNLTSYATIDRRIFNPLEFTGVGMQPLSVTPAYARIDAVAGQPISSDIANRLAPADAVIAHPAANFSTKYALHWPQTFDYLIYYHFGAPKNFNTKALREVRRGSFFTIYSIDRNGRHTGAVRLDSPMAEGGA